MSNIEFKWLMSNDEECENQPNLLATYYREVANGPMTSYRYIKQSGSKQGQSYYTHVLDGIGMFYKIRAAGIVDISDLEEMLLYAAFTVHDLNKIPPYGGRDIKLSFSNIATTKNISAELDRIDFNRFFPEWETYREDIRLLVLLHQHDTAPTFDLNQNNHNYTLRYERLLELGLLMYAVDNLDLSHTLAESNHKQSFLATINALSKRRWRWVSHQLGENRALLSNIIHNGVVTYLQKRHTYNQRSIIADLLYYPDGVAYLLPEREVFTWSHNDSDLVAQHITQLIEAKKSSSFERFLLSKPRGIKVADAAIESQVAYTDIMFAIRRMVERKRYTEKKWNELNQNLHGDIAKVLSGLNQDTTGLVNITSNNLQPLIPFEQSLLQCGVLVAAYRNLLEDHLKIPLEKMHKCDPWTHIYALLDLPQERYVFYDQVDIYRRAYYIICDYVNNIDELFDCFLKDVVILTGEQVAPPLESHFLCDYISTNLEISGVSNSRDFQVYLQRYVKDNHKQCCSCSSPAHSVELMNADVSDSLRVQVFSNRLKGGGGEPKRNVCPICRTQFILEKLTWIFFRKKGKSKGKNSEKLNSELYTSFYLHLYPYAFFTASFADSMYSTLKNICREENQCLLLNTNRYFQKWEEQLERNLASRIEKQASMIDGETNSEFTGSVDYIKGINVPNFSDAVSNTPTLPLNAFGENYSQQFLFALSQALMIADFFGCRVVMSRTPIPLLTSDYMAEHALSFFVDGVPLDLRWLLPTNEYRSIETYREGNLPDGGVEYLKRLSHWSNEQPDEQGYAALENVYRRLSTLSQLSSILQSNNTPLNEILLEMASALVDDPLSAYHIADLAIEKKIRDVNSSNKKRTGKKTKSASKDGGTNGEQPKKAISSENLAVYLSKRVAPLLASLVKE